MTGFPERIAHLVPLDPGADDLDNQVEEFKSDVTDTGKLVLDYAHDPRIVWLASFMKEYKDKKILLICHTVQKAVAIEKEGIEILLDSQKLFNLADQYANTGIDILKNLVFGDEPGSFETKVEKSMFEILQSCGD